MGTIHFFKEVLRTKTNVRSAGKCGKILVTWLKGNQSKARGVRKTARNLKGEQPPERPSRRYHIYIIKNNLHLQVTSK